MKHLATSLRNNPTDAERHLWRYLRKSQLAGHKFRRQEVLGDFIVDFICLDAKLIVELDGGQHLEQRDKDEARTAYLNSLGYKVLRYWNHQVLNQTPDVLEDIRRYLLSPPPNPLLQGGGTE